MAKVRLKWTDAEAGEDGVKIYRSGSAIDPGALPSPIASVPKGRGIYEDPDASAGTQHYYVAAFSDDEIGPGAASSLTAVEELPRFVLGTQQVAVTSGTSVVVTLPDCKAGDLLIIYGFRRSAQGTHPAGWTYGPVPANDGDAAITDQWCFVYYKEATGTEGGTTVTLAQTSAGRIVAGVAVVRHHSGGPITVTSLGTARYNGAADTNIFTGNTIGFTNGASKALVFSVTSWVFSATTGDASISVASNRMMPVLPPKWPYNEPNMGQMRLMGWFTEADASEVFTSGAVTLSVTPTGGNKDSRSEINLALTV